MRDRSLCAFTAGGEMHTISSVGKFVVPEIRFCVPAALSNTHTAAALRDPTATLMALTRRTQRSHLLTWRLCVKIRIGAGPKSSIDSK